MLLAAFWLVLAAPDCIWLLLVAPWQLLAAPWLLLATPDCSWLLLASPGCSWLLMIFLFRAPELFFAMTTVAVMLLAQPVTPQREALVIPAVAIV